MTGSADGGWKNERRREYPGTTAYVRLAEAELAAVEAALVHARQTGAFTERPDVKAQAARAEKALREARERMESETKRRRR